MKKTIRYKYCLLNKRGSHESWTGIFHTAEEADAWYEKWGKKHEAEGRKLVRVEVIYKTKIHENN